MKIKIIVAAHKAYRVPEDEIYLPLQVGADCSQPFGFTQDNTGDHISGKNPSYCELTGLYWLWKNVDADYYGLVHYRRLFANPGAHAKKRDPYAAVLDRHHLEQILRQTDLILPKKRNYYIETIYSHYAHTHYPEHLDAARAILEKRCPEYVPAFDALMKGTKAHMFNMMIMGREKFDSYCAWLFPILAELEEKFSRENYDAFQARYVGRISELLLNVWVDKHQYAYQELPLVMIGQVNWPRKICAFLQAKFRSKRYDSSF